MFITLVLSSLESVSFIEDYFRHLSTFCSLVFCLTCSSRFFLQLLSHEEILNSVVLNAKVVVLHLSSGPSIVFSAVLAFGLSFEHRTRLDSCKEPY